MTDRDQMLTDLGDLLLLCRDQVKWPGQRAIIEGIQARYGAAIKAQAERRLAELRKAA